MLNFELRYSSLIVVFLLGIFAYHTCQSQTSKPEIILTYLKENPEYFRKVVCEDMKGRCKFYSAKKKSLQFEVIDWPECEYRKSRFINGLNPESADDRVLIQLLSQLSDSSYSPSLKRLRNNSTDTSSVYVINFCELSNEITLMDINYFFGKEEKYAIGSILSIQYHFLFYFDKQRIKRILYSSMRKF